MGSQDRVSWAHCAGVDDGRFRMPCSWDHVGRALHVRLWMGDRGRDGSVAGGRRPAGDLRSVSLGSQRRRGAHRWDGVGVVEAAADLEYLLLAMWVAPVAEPVCTWKPARGWAIRMDLVRSWRHRPARQGWRAPRRLGRSSWVAGSPACVCGQGGVASSTAGCSEEVECACLEGARRACLVESARAEVRVPRVTACTRGACVTVRHVCGSPQETSAVALHTRARVREHGACEAHMRDRSSRVREDHASAFAHRFP